MSAILQREAHMPASYFVTGTDTEVGKTLVATAMLNAARSRGLRTIGLKPVASGAELVDGALRNPDACALAGAMTESLHYDEINPFPFARAVAPHLAAEDANLQLSAHAIARHCKVVLSRPHEFSIVEGAGGWRVPISATESLADVAVALGLPVVLVVGVRLGCINHAILSAEGIRSDGLELAGWVANVVDPDMCYTERNIATIQGWVKSPCIGVVPFLRDPSGTRVTHLLDIGLLAH